ncbi:transglycosylase domain-containing protein [Sporolactobacillus sp. THM19-2]|uniref:transglycosylase domain-containing protein n=1 Tax=Sporolactobacillus sp. THM19-2 TaxID=2511171 RepID=UPI00102180B0|nr:PBP1A family penicillin-binding protein [Sporolactobacillus sp. THM19-2]RYL93318.1 PBP1A family penicillin-binding protein [Sporolactobacillus sp. THM19-2]
MVEYHTRMERRRAAELERKRANDSPSHKHRKPSGGGGKKRGWFKRVMIILSLIILFMILAGAVTVFAIIKNAPALNEQELKNPASSVIYDQNDKEAMIIDAGENREYMPIESIPAVVQDAYISTEDVRFYRHFGVDPIRIMGAGVAQFTKGFKSEGASTITQQVVRNAMLSQNKTFTRKIQEAYLAIQLEKQYTKKQILEMYLNQIYLGSGPTYGVAAASQHYFGTELKNITLPQAAMLAAMTRNPGYYDPITHPDRAKQRRDLVLDLMVSNKAITPEQAAHAKSVSMKEMTAKHKENKPVNRKYGAFLDYIRRVLVDQEKVISEQEFTSGGLKIYTTLDPKIQKRTEDILNNEKNYPNVQKNFNGAVSVIDTQTGAIRALGGGRNYQYSNTNRAFMDGRSIGSTSKPLMDYGPAIEYLKWPTDYMVDDKQGTTYSGSNQEVGNWDGKFMGPMTIRKALYLSRNVPALRTMQEFIQTKGSSKPIRTFARNLGIRGEVVDPTQPFQESYAIGSFSSTPLQMAGAYAAFGNNGVYNEPYGVRKIVKPDGEIIQLDHQRRVAMHDYTAYMITDMLKDVMTKGTGTWANIPGTALAGKTGTQNIDDDFAAQHHISKYDQDHGATAAWFVGYTSRLTTAVWTGYSGVKSDSVSSKDFGTFLGTGEQRYSMTIFKNIMTPFMPGAPDFVQPDSVIHIGGGELAVKNADVKNHSNQEKDEGNQQGDNSSSSMPSSSSSSAPASSSQPPATGSSVSSSSSQSSSSSSASTGGGQGNGNGNNGNGNNGSPDNSSNSGTTNSATTPDQPSSPSSSSSTSTPTSSTSTSTSTP